MDGIGNFFGPAAALWLHDAKLVLHGQQCPKNICPEGGNITVPTLVRAASTLVKVKSEGYAMQLRLVMSLKVAIILVIIGFLLLMLVAFELIEAQFTSVCPKSDARCAPSHHHAHGAIPADHS